MINFDKIDFSEEIDVNETSSLKERDICYYWYFLNKGFKFQPNVWNRYDIAILSIQGSDYCCIISRISINEAIHLIQNIDLTEKIGAL